VKLSIQELAYYLRDLFVFDKRDFFTDGSGGHCMMVRLRRRESDSVTPFFVFSDGVNFWVQAGSVNGYVPTLDGNPVTNVPAPKIALITGTATVAIKVTVSLIKNTAGDYVKGYSEPPTLIIECVLTADLLLEPSSTGAYHIPLATFSNKIKTSQLVFSSLAFNVEDADGSARTAAGDDTTDEFTDTAHGYADGDVIAFAGGDAEAMGISGRSFYIINAATDTYQISETVGGSAFALLDSGSATSRKMGLGRILIGQA